MKTAAKTGDNSSTIVYLGVIALSALTIIVSRKRKIYK
ncbi:MAG: LPXTG cell wall anchor domain-containing protein [Lachnospiraceae bacterium]